MISVVMRATKLRSRPCICMSTWPSAKPEGRDFACSKRAANSGSAVLNGLAEQVLFRRAEKLQGGTVGERYFVIGINANDAGAHARQHGFGEAPPLVKLVICLQQFVLMLGHLIGHEIEGAGQRFQIADAFDGADLGGKITLGHAPRCIQQAHNRCHQPVGKPQADPHGRQQEDKGHDAHTSCQR